jgi:transposase
MRKTKIAVAPPERLELKRRAASRTGRADDAKRARLILKLAAGHSYSQIMRSLECSQNYIVRWKSRFLAERIAGLYARHRGRAPSKDAAKIEARILAHTQRPPADGTTHWSTRKLGTKLGLSHNRVARVWARARLQPHRLRRYMASDDPLFEAKATDIIGLYLKPPANAAVFCVDEKSAIQALDRLDPVLPLSPGRAERHGFEYHRHGTLSLYAALETRTGQIVGKTALRHTSAEFVAFLAQIVAHQPTGRQIHIIADNLSAHKTKGVSEFLQSHPLVRLHYTPTYSSWLNQVELWFSKIERDLIARGIFSSVADLRRKLMRYIRHYNKAPKAFKWSWRDPSHRIAPTHLSSDTVH